MTIGTAHSAIILRDISKGFPGVQALQNVSFSVEPGQVRALLGENGAGKSTLLKILSGIYRADTGEVIVKGKPVDSAHTKVSPAGWHCADPSGTAADPGA